MRPDRDSYEIHTTHLSCKGLFALDCGRIYVQARRSFDFGVSFVYMFFIIFGWSFLFLMEYKHTGWRSIERTNLVIQSNVKDLIHYPV